MKGTGKHKFKTLNKVKKLFQNVKTSLLKMKSFLFPAFRKVLSFLETQKKHKEKATQQKSQRNTWAESCQFFFAFGHRLTAIFSLIAWHKLTKYQVDHQPWPSRNCPNKKIKSFLTCDNHSICHFLGFCVSLDFLKNCLFP